jgi:hypothetical protein
VAGNNNPETMDGVPANPSAASGPTTKTNEIIAHSAPADDWLNAMRRGDFRRALAANDADMLRRRDSGIPPHIGPRHLQHVWSGESLAGKRVFVRCYHGLGDTIQFIRFARPLRKIANEVVVWAQAPLLPLIRTAAGIDDALALHDGIPEARCDVDIEIMELPHALRANQTMIACQVPYLFPKPTCRKNLAPSSEYAVGIVWQSGNWDPRRSIPHDLLAPLTHVSRIRLFSLQRGPAAVQAGNIPADDVSSDDIHDVVSTLHSLDLLITVDTFLAHLAGALGVMTWLLLPEPCDWRWMQHRTDSIWYPSIRLFRQPTSGDWQAVIASVATALRQDFGRAESST